MVCALRAGPRALPLQALGEVEVRRRSAQEDKPLRMIKTLLHELCKLRKERIFDDARAMPGEGGAAAPGLPLWPAGMHAGPRARALQHALPSHSATLGLAQRFPPLGRARRIYRYPSCRDVRAVCAFSSQAWL